MVLTNPPFGKKSSYHDRQTRTERARRKTSPYLRDDFWATTSNKQLNFFQHVPDPDGGRAAIIMPGQRAFRGGRG